MGQGLAGREFRIDFVNLLMYERSARGETLNCRFSRIVLRGVFAVALALTLCGQVDARGTIIGAGDPRSGVKDPFRGVYEVRGEGFVHTAGALWVNMSNLGVIGNPWKALSTDPSCQYPPGSGVEYLWGAGIWVGGMIGEDPTPRVSTAIDQLEFRPSTLPVDTIYESYEGFPGGKRFVNDDGDRDIFGKKIVDEEIHDGRDNDGDGLIDEDFAAISQQMFTCVYRDDTPEALNTYPEHVPMGLEITQKSFAWGIPGSDNFVGIEYTIKNDGRHDLHDVYLGFFCDADVGPESEELYWRDDRAGLVEIDTTVGGVGEGGCATKPERLRFMVGETHDNDGDEGRTEGWLGTVLLGHTTDRSLYARKAPPTVELTSFRFVSGGAAYEKCGDPRNDFQRYDLLSSNMIGCRPGELTATEDGDYRMFFGAGPFGEFKKGEELTLQVAFVIGDGRSGMIENAVAAQRIFNGEYWDLDNNPWTGINGRETCLIRAPGEPIRSFDYVEHCDRPEIEYLGYRPQKITEPDCISNRDQMVDLDCDKCTGSGGKEGMARWRGATAPPCPQVETGFPPDEEYPCHTLTSNEDTGITTRDAINGPTVQLLTEDEAVLIRWNNASELVADPLSGILDFAGYRVWRAEQWERPEGSTGPTPELWILLAEYRLPRYIEPRTGHIDLSLARDGAVTAPCDTVDVAKGRYLYPVGYYQHRDEHVLPGFTYFYSVTAFDMNDTGDLNPRTGEAEKFSIECRHVATSEQAVVPGTNPVDGIGEVYVVPNPYYGNARWDLVPNPRDPTGTHVDFMNLPTGPWTIRIYTLAGDLVRTLDNDSGNDIGQVKWDLVSRNGQDIVTGVYLYSVESRYGSQVGKFLILKESTYSR
jgi:hypothetical protein